MILPVLGSSIDRCRVEVSSGNTLADGWSEPFLQKVRIGGGPTREVYQTRPVLIEHRVVRAGLAVPDRLVAPIGRRRQRVVLGRLRLRIAHRHLDGGCLVIDRIEDRHEVGAVLGRAVDQAIGVERRLALVGRRDVVQIVLGIGEVPLRDDDVALAPLRPRRLRRRQFAGGDAVGPIRVELERARRVDAADRGRHVVHRLPGQDAPRPGVLRLHVGEHRRDRTGGLVAERVTAVAAVGLDHVEPLRLALHLAEREFMLRRHLQHRIPVDRRIDVGCGLGRRRRHRREVDDLARLALDLRRVDEAIAAHEDLVARARQVGDQVAPLIVGDHALDIAGRKVGGFRDHPDARLRRRSAR